MGRDVFMLLEKMTVALEKITEECNECSENTYNGIQGYLENKFSMSMVLVRKFQASDIG